MSFGERLRSAREAMRLSQADLGGDRYSSSYISHLEHDRRRPTPEVVDFLARRLGMPPSSLASPPTDAVSNAQVVVTEGAMRVQDALLRRDFDAVIAGTEEMAVDAALADASAWWASLKLRAEALIVRGEYESSLAVLCRLLDSEITRASNVLLASALVLQSRALRASGQLTEALASAINAVEAAVQVEDVALEVSARLVELAARGELGQREELADAAHALRSARRHLADGQLKGQAAWSIGNVQFLLGNRDDGVREHDLAASLLDAEVDVREWARFHKATAAMRIAAGLTDGIDDLLDKAEQGLSIVGNSHDLAELDLTRAEWLVATAPTEAEQISDRLLARTDLPAQTLAEAHSVRARALGREGRDTEARHAWAHAADLFEQLGAQDRAIAIWRRLAHIEAS